MTSPEATHRAIETVWRIESAGVVAHVARLVRDVGVAEELAQDALVTALERWPADGLPDNPAAWLITAARSCACALPLLNAGKRQVRVLPPTPCCPVPPSRPCLPTTASHR